PRHPPTARDRSRRISPPRTFEHRHGYRSDSARPLAFSATGEISGIARLTMLAFSAWTRRSHSSTASWRRHESSLHELAAAEAGTQEMALTLAPETDRPISAGTRKILHAMRDGWKGR